jgi:hypothetical protein
MTAGAVGATASGASTDQSRARCPEIMELPGDSAGVDVISQIVITPDGTSYCHNYVRFLSDLYVVEGIK